MSRTFAGLEAFQQPQLPSRRLAPSQASLTKMTLYLSKELAQQLGSQTKYVALSFNRTTQEIALEPVPEEQAASRGAYKLSCRAVSTTALYRHFQITARGRFPAIFKDGRVVVSLKRGSAESEVARSLGPAAEPSTPSTPIEKEAEHEPRHQ
jgi:hypothetical protein